MQQNRDRSGRYDFDNMDALCVCGRRLGDHIAEAPHECDATDCRKFVLADKKGES